jgi:DNA-binding response OmpR family regulator
MAGERILIIEDDRLVQRVVTDILKEKDYNVESADSGEDGIVMAEISNYDVILLDINLPGINGIDTLRGILKVKPGSTVIMLTGNPTLESVMDAIQIGAVDYLSKTIDSDKLNSAILKAIRNKKGKKTDRLKVIKPIVDEIFLMYKNGELIKHFTRRLKPDMDPEIFSSMLVAVQNFVKDSFRNETGELNGLQFGNFRVLICRGKCIILAVFIEGEETESLKAQLRKTVDDMEGDKPERLASWKGMMAELDYLEKYVKKLIDKA